MRTSLEYVQSTLHSLWSNEEFCHDYFNDIAEYSKPSQQTMPKLLFDKRGVELYGRLMRYGWHDTMSAIYPACETLLKEQWRALVERYLKVCPPSHFNLNQIGKQFSNYLIAFEEAIVKDYPFIAQLADYEWLELEVLEHSSIVSREPWQPLETTEQFAALHPKVNPTLCLRHYDYRIADLSYNIENGQSIDEISEAQETFVAGFRPFQSIKSNLIETNNLSVLILEKAASKAFSYRDLALVTIQFYDNEEPGNAIIEFIELVESLQEMDVLVGSTPV
ncbi:MAG: hypothetical protein C0508_10050 [Cyanobacteria bacterium PR.023]|nr:hypothetical protein [Cyanobacteria bacterium DS2.008]MBA4075376.1 hypothetical protein [Cyanobacteria bacterium PR.023]